MTNTASNLYVNNRVVKKILFNDAEMYTSKGWAYKPEDYFWSKEFTVNDTAASSTRLYSDNKQNRYVCADFYWSNPSTNQSGTRTVLTKYSPWGTKCWSIDSSDNIPKEIKGNVTRLTYTYVTVDDSDNDTLWAIMHTCHYVYSSYIKEWDYLIKIDNKTGTILKTVDIHKVLNLSDDAGNSYTADGLIVHKGNVFSVLTFMHQYENSGSTWSSYSRYFLMFDSEGTLKQKPTISVTYRPVRGMAMKSNGDIIFVMYNTAYIVRKADNYSSINRLSTLNDEVDDSYDTAILKNSIVLDTIGTFYCATRYQIQKYGNNNFELEKYYIYVYDEKKNPYRLDILGLVVDRDDCLYVLATGHDTVSTNTVAKDYLIKYSPDSTMLWQYKVDHGVIPPASLASFGIGVGFSQAASGNKDTDVCLLTGIPK